MEGNSIYSQADTKCVYPSQTIHQYSEYVILKVSQAYQLAQTI